MSKRVYLVLGVLLVALLVPLIATAQQPEPPVFTYVAEWAVPRAQWDEFTAFWEKNNRPIIERMYADGTLVGWGRFASRVHTETGTTHGNWLAATSIAGSQRVLDETLKLPQNPGTLGAKHHDHLFRSLIHRGRPAGPTSGYLWVSIVQAQPGKGQQGRELWEKYFKPTYDELLGNGTISMYELAVEHVHTEDPGLRYVWYIAPSADAVDKVRAAFTALEQKRSPEENRAIGAAFAEVSVAGAHRDFFARVSNYTHK